MFNYDTALIIIVILMIMWVLLTTFQKYDNKSETFQSLKYHLGINEKLLRGQRLTSSNGKYIFVNQKGDGNVCLYLMKPKQRGIWCNMTQKKNTLSVEFEKNGNLVQYNKSRKILWQSKTGGSGATNVILTDNGELIMTNANNVIVWTLIKKHKHLVGTKYKSLSLDKILPPKKSHSENPILSPGVCNYMNNYI